jgi:hypothetical protein
VTTRKPAAPKTAAKSPAARKAAPRKVAAAKPANRTLRAVKPGEAAPEEPKEIASLVDAIDRGTYEDVLVWQRKDAVKALPLLGGPALAAMHRQIAALSKEIEAIRAAKTEGTDIGTAIDAPDEEFDADAL